MANSTEYGQKKVHRHAELWRLFSDLTPALLHGMALYVWLFLQVSFLCWIPAAWRDSKRRAVYLTLFWKTNAGKMYLWYCSPISKIFSTTIRPSPSLSTGWNYSNWRDLGSFNPAVPRPETALWKACENYAAWSRNIEEGNDSIGWHTFIKRADE